MVIVRALRPDRVLFATSKYVSNNMGPQYVDPPPFDLKAVYESSNSTTPLVFVLSPGKAVSVPCCQALVLHTYMHILIHIFS